MHEQTIPTSQYWVILELKCSVYSDFPLCIQASTPVLNFAQIYLILITWNVMATAVYRVSTVISNGHSRIRMLGQAMWPCILQLLPFFSILLMGASLSHLIIFFPTILIINLNTGDRKLTYHIDEIHSIRGPSWAVTVKDRHYHSVIATQQYEKTHYITVWPSLTSGVPSV